MKAGESIHSQFAILRKVKDAPLAGVYQKTSVDIEKEEADFLLLQVDPYIVDSKVILFGRGVTLMDVKGRYRLTEKALEVAQSKYTWMADF